MAQILSKRTSSPAQVVPQKVAVLCTELWISTL